MKDLFKDSRKKSRFIIELRYPALVNIFDKRGLILNEIHPLFQKKIEHWKVDAAQVIMSNNFEMPTK